MQTQFESMHLSPDEQETSQAPQLLHELVKSTQTWQQTVRCGSLQAALQPPSAQTAWPPLGTIQVLALEQVVVDASGQMRWSAVGVEVQAQ